MSLPRAPQPAKLVIGLFLNDRSLLAAVVDDLERSFGPIELAGLWLDFDFTKYYTREMGAPLYRRMLVFKGFIDQESLAPIKCRTNEIELRYSHGGKRKVNIDPGYLLHERFVLATGKNFTHRIYIGRGIYADLTLIYQKGAFQTLPWTYPDYAADDMRAFLLLVRQRYAAELAASIKRKGVVPPC